MRDTLLGEYLSLTCNGRWAHSFLFCRARYGLDVSKCQFTNDLMLSLSVQRSRSAAGIRSMHKQPSIGPRLLDLEVRPPCVDHNDEEDKAQRRRKGDTPSVDLI